MQKLLVRTLACVRRRERRNASDIVSCANPLAGRARGEKLLSNAMSMFPASTELSTEPKYEGERMNATCFRAHKYLLLSIFALVMVVAHSAWGADVARTEVGQITSLEAGWADNTLAVRTTATVINPAGCTTFHDGYVTLPSDPGSPLYHDILRDAFFNYYPVQLLISGAAGDCPYGKPRIISVLISR